MQAVERRAMENYAISGLQLMECAALELCRFAQSLKPNDVFIVCGPGNNGGDGLALARLLHLEGVPVQVRLLVDADALKGDALANAHIVKNLGLSLTSPWPEHVPDLIVDALFGTGLNRAPQGEYLSAIRRINAYCEQGSRVLSVDIPSGIDGKTGRPTGDAAVQATYCMTFQWLKRGHLLVPGRGYCKDLRLVSIGIPDVELPLSVFTLEEKDALGLLPARPWDSHKNSFGHGLLLAGSFGMAGAAQMAARAVLGGGIGLLSCACPEKSVLPIVQTQVPAAMAIPLSESVPDAEVLARALSGKTAVAAGPGLGQSDIALARLRTVWQSELPLIVDADGLNLLAAHADEFSPRSAPLLLTPHPGEAARLLGRRVEDAIEDARELARRYKAVCLLKGATTVIAAPDGRVCLNTTGSSALATGGSGDVLTGLLLSLLCQKMDVFEAACLGAYLHGRAGEKAGKLYGQRALNGWQLAQMNFYEGLEG